MEHWAVVVVVVVVDVAMRRAVSIVLEVVQPRLPAKTTTNPADCVARNSSRDQSIRLRHRGRAWGFRWIDSMLMIPPD